MTVNWSDLIVGAIGAFIGAGAAFVFALWLANIQTTAQRRDRLLDEKSRDLVTIRAAMALCIQNIEDALAFKRQIVLPMAEETAAISAAISPGIPVPQLLTSLQTHGSFFKNYEAPIFEPLLEVDRYAFLLGELPYFLSLLHSAERTQKSVPIFVSLRNEAAAAWAAKATSGITALEISYHLTMMISHSQALAAAVDDALYFHQLLAEQMYYIGVEQFIRPRFPFFKLAETHRQLMPAADYVPSFRLRLNTFGHPPPEGWENAQADATTSEA